MKTTKNQTPDHTQKILLVFVALLLLFNLQGQEANEEPPRKTVGVVLSGGGSKGLAHVGVLKALEENNIAIDYIAGTSIGAMVGGLYAAGYSPDEILELMSSREFINASRGLLSKEHDFYFFHHDPTPSWLRFNFSLDHVWDLQGVIMENLPSNLVSPGMMDFMFMEYLGPASVAAEGNFDNLFIPFRCIASDITNKEAVVMKRGHLSEAVRASMTFPFYFKPIVIDGKVLFDGGMFNNFPADVVKRDFNPDIIIGSVVASNPEPPCVNDIVSQLENMLMVFSDYSLPEGANGIILFPDVPDLGVTDFSQNEMVFQTGYQAVINNLDSIHSLNPHTRFIQEVMYHRREFRKSYPESRIGNIILDEPADAAGRFAKSFLLPDNRAISLEEFRENYYRLLSLDKFRHIYPRMYFNNEMRYYEVELQLQQRHPMNRSFGGNLSSQSINQLFLEFTWEKLAEYPFKLFANTFVGNSYNSAKLGVRVDFLKRNPFYFLAETSISRWNYATETIFLFEEQKPSFIYQNEFYNNFRLVFPWGYKGKFETGGLYSRKRNEFYNTAIFSRSDTTDQSSVRPAGIFVLSEKNTLDHYQYPTSGSYLNISARYLWATEIYKPGSTAITRSPAENQLHWWELNLQWENFFTTGNRFRPSVLSEIFLSNRPVLSNYSASRILSKQYSPFAFAQTRYLDTFRANNFVAGGLKATFMLSRSWMLQAEAHAFQPLRETRQGVSYTAYYSRPIIKPEFMYHTALVYHTPMGPLSAGAYFFPGEEESFAFIINFGYILFNRRTF